MQNVEKKSLVWIIESFILRDICFINVNVIWGSQQGIIFQGNSQIDTFSVYVTILWEYKMPISRIIDNDFLKHKQANINVKSRRFGIIMTPFSREK